MFNKLFGKKEKVQKIKDMELNYESRNLKLRDTRKSKEYFLHKLDTMKENIGNIVKNHRQNLETNNKKGLEVTNFNLSQILFLYPQVWYSVGKKIDENWKITYYEYFPCFLDSIGENYIYKDMMKILSIGILLNIEEKYFIQVSNKLKSIKYQDSFIDFLVNSQYSSHQISEKIFFPDEKASKILDEIRILQGAEVINLIDIYLNKYFNTKENLDREFNSHKQSNNMYKGYWAWEVAAVVKVKGLDDSKFKDNPYYPYDMVHWKEE